MDERERPAIRFSDCCEACSSVSWRTRCSEKWPCWPPHYSSVLEHCWFDTGRTTSANISRQKSTEVQLSATFGLTWSSLRKNWPRYWYWFIPHPGGCTGPHSDATQPANPIGGLGLHASLRASTAQMSTTPPSRAALLFTESDRDRVLTGIWTGQNHSWRTGFAVCLQLARVNIHFTTEITRRQEKLKLKITVMNTVAV